MSWICAIVRLAWRSAAMPSVGGDAGILGVVADEVRQRVAVGDAVAIILHPALECFGRIGDGVGAVRRRLPAVKDALGVACHLLLGLEDGDGVAAAMRMPARKLEVLGVSSCECVANVRERAHRVGLGRSVCSHLPRQVRGLFARLEADGVVVAQHDFDANNEIHFLPAQVVGGAIRDIGFGRGEAPCVHIRASVHSASRVGCRGQVPFRFRSLRNYY